MLSNKLLILLFLISVAAAQILLKPNRSGLWEGGGAEPDPETLAPDGVTINNGYVGDETDIDDDPDAHDVNLLTIAQNTAGDVIIQFPTPNTSPIGTQTFRIALSETPTNANQTTEAYTIDLYENGVQVTASIATGSNIATDPSAEVFDATWDAGDLGTADGSLVECYISTTPETGGMPGNRGSVQVEAVEWNKN